MDWGRSIIALWGLSRRRPTFGHALVYAIAANAHKDSLRKKRVRRLFLLERTRSMAAGTADADRGWDTPGASSPDGETRSDIRRSLERAVSRLPGRERRVFVLKDIEGFKHGEIARMLRIPEPTVRTLLHRAVRRLREELAEFRPAAGADRVFEEILILASRALPFLSCRSQNAQLLVPICLERVGNEAIVRVDQHESALRQIRFDLRALDGAAAELIGLFVPRFVLASDVERQLDRGGRHLLSDERSDRLIDGRPRDRLAVRPVAIAGRAIADIPGWAVALAG